MDRDDERTDEPATSQREQDLEGWTTLREDTAMQYTSIAVASSTSHTMIVGGASNGRWALQRKTTSGSFTSVDAGFDLGHGGQVNAVAVAASGVFFAAGISYDAAGKSHAIVRRGTNDGQSWSTVLDATGVHGAEAYGVTVDSSGIGWASGHVGDSLSRGTVWTGTTAGTWGEIHSIGSQSATGAVGFNGVCTGTYKGVSAIYAVGFYTAGVPDSGRHTAVDVGTKSGSTWTWTNVLDHEFRSSSAATGCTQGLGTTLWISGNATDNAGSSFVVINFTESSGAWSEAGFVTTAQDSSAQGVIQLLTATYVFGTTWSDTGNWRVRYKLTNGAGWEESENWHKTGASGPATAFAAATDPSVGFVIAGTVTTSSGARHGIIRHRD